VVESAAGEHRGRAGASASGGPGPSGHPAGRGFAACQRKRGGV